MPAPRSCIERERTAWDTLAGKMATEGYMAVLRRAIRTVDPDSEIPPPIPGPLMSKLEELVRRDPARTRRIFLATWGKLWRPLLDAFDRPPADPLPDLKPAKAHQDSVVASIVEALVLHTADDATLERLAEVTSWLFVPAVAHARKAFAFWRLSLQGLDLACRLDRFRDETGRHPAVLSELGEVSGDPFAQGPLVYRTGTGPDGRSWHALTTQGPRQDADERLSSFVDAGFDFDRFEKAWEDRESTTFMVWGVRSP
ncbi:MAG TPA: hypothetical protein VEJ18_00610 [Planctomycetota bacterium]|nr:hypothetical protein [Planctomycetota bacterium]